MALRTVGQRRGAKFCLSTPHTRNGFFKKTQQPPPFLFNAALQVHCYASNANRSKTSQLQTFVSVALPSCPATSLYASNTQSFSHLVSSSRRFYAQRQRLTELASKGSVTSAERPPELPVPFQRNFSSSVESSKPAQLPEVTDFATINTSSPPGRSEVSGRNKSTTTTISTFQQNFFEKPSNHEIMDDKSAVTSTIDVSRPLETLAADAAIMEPLSPLDAIQVVRRISKDDHLLKTVIAQGMTAKSRKKWIEGLVETIERELGRQPIVKRDELQTSSFSLSGSSASLPLQPTDKAVVGSLTSVPAETIPVDHKEKADHIFRLLDVNHDGLVGLREFRIWFSTYYLGVHGNRQPKAPQSSVLEQEKFDVLTPPGSASILSTSDQEDIELSPVASDAKASLDPTTLPTNTSAAPAKPSSLCSPAPIAAVCSQKPAATSKLQSLYKLASSDTLSAPDNVGDVQIRSTKANAKESTSENATTSSTMLSASERSKQDAQLEKDMDEEDEEDVEWRLLFQVILRSSIPYLAFGIIDNGYTINFLTTFFLQLLKKLSWFVLLHRLMLSCGEWIDSTIAVRFCLTSMAVNFLIIYIRT